MAPGGYPGRTREVSGPQSRVRGTWPAPGGQTRQSFGASGSPGRVTSKTPGSLSEDAVGPLASFPGLPRGPVRWKGTGPFRTFSVAKPEGTSCAGAAREGQGPCLFCVLHGDPKAAGEGRE